MDELLRMKALEIVQLLKDGEISSKELIEKTALRIDTVDREINALPVRCFERAIEKADQFTSSGNKNRDENFLYGLPIAIKDTAQVQGVRTTYGSRIFADHIPTRSDIFVETLEQNGALVVAKSNAPEFGAGANTFNDVFGKTLNPWNTALTSGGSSGGSAAALATGQVWLATGSDLGGSLRIPAGFCSVVGFRPSPGRVAKGPDILPFETLSVVGPMARCVSDVALMMDAMVGRRDEDPLSLPRPRRSFLKAIDRPEIPKKVAFSLDLNGLVPTDKQISDVCLAAIKKFEEVGSDITEKSPNFEGMKDVISVLRDTWSALPLAEHMRNNRHLLKEEILASIEKGMHLNTFDVVEAEMARGALYRQVVKFFEDFDILLVPTTITKPFDVNIRFLKEFNGQRFQNYVEWFLITYFFSLTTCPVLSLPVGFTPDGLPVGLQIIGAPYQDAKVLNIACLLEEMLGTGQTPIDPISKEIVS